MSFVVSFFIPEKYLPDAARREAWKSGVGLSLLGEGKAATAQAWIYQTWLKLTEAGFPACLVHDLPKAGIVVALTGTLPPRYRPPGAQFLLGVAADGLPHPGANLHLLQNAAHAARLPGSVFMPHWPHPQLVPRDPQRGDVFRNVRFHGDARNLPGELAAPAFAEALRTQLDLTFEIRPPNQWHDYSDADCVLAIRTFDRKPLLSKPATKLYNAWLAGVPVLGGLDSAVGSDGNAGTDYLPCKSPNEVFDALHRLKADAVLRRSLVESGTRTGQKFSQSATSDRWKELLLSVCDTHAPRWQNRSSMGRRVFYLRQEILLAIDRAFLS